MTNWLLLICGCQSLSPRLLLVLQFLLPQAPKTWFMQPHTRGLTQRMLNELSESPATVIKD